MAITPNSAGSNDIGLIPDTAPDSPASRPSPETETLSARKVGPDGASPIQPDEESVAAQATTEPPAPESRQPQDPMTEHKDIPGRASANGPGPGEVKTDPPLGQEEPAAKVQPPIASPGITAEPRLGTDANSHKETEAPTTEGMKASYGAALLDDMDDAQLLLSYVTRNGLQEDRKVSDDTIKTLIRAGHRLSTGAFDCETEEPQFRKDYGIIARAAAPVTVASLRDSLPTPPQHRWTRLMEGEPRSLAERKCFNYRDAAFLVLALLVFCQIYWTMASSVLTKTDVLISDLNSKFPPKEWYRSQHAESLGGLKTPNQPSTTEAVAPKPAPPPTNAPPTTATETKETKPPPSRDEYVSKIAELNSSYVMLRGLLRPLAWVFFHGLFSDFDLSPQKKDEVKPQENSPVSIPSINVAGTSASPAGKETSSEPKKEAAPDPEAIFNPSRFQTQNATVSAVGRQVVDIMQKWLLPLLYGALGALVYVVRTLSSQARDRLFRKEAVVSLNLRVYLGTIAGLAIGWFWSQGPPAAGAAGPMSLATLSPFALAFIAGYGVEIFFALLDKLIAAFTSK